MLVVDHVLRLGGRRVGRVGLPVPAHGAQDAAAAAAACPLDEWLLQLLVVMEAAACGRRNVDISQFWQASFSQALT